MSEIQVDLNNKVLVSLDDKMLTNFLLPDLVFEHNQAQFPPRWGSTTGGRITFTSSGTNTVYVDFGDGSEVYSEQFEGDVVFNADTPIHNYIVADNYKVGIRFEFPELIKEFQIYFCPLIGDFPSQLGLYKLDEIYIHSARFENFPTNLSSGIYEVVTLQNMTMSTINNIPDWILSSAIKQLRLIVSFNLNDINTSNLDKLINIQGLETFYTSRCNIANNSIPSNWKDITTLRTIGLGENPITEITENINNCKQITTLIFGLQPGVTYQNNSLISWGVGVANMPNLQRLEWNRAINAPATLPTGIETAPNLKTMYARSAYTTQERIDEFVENTYAIVENIADITGANNLLRQIYLHVGSYSGSDFSEIFRPSGAYQATGGYEVGVSNGSPTTAMEKIYVLVNQYDWTVVVLNEAGSNNQVYAP